VADEAFKHYKILRSSVFVSSEGLFQMATHLKDI